MYAGAADEGLQALHHEGAAAGRELLLPHRGEARPCPRDGLLPGIKGEGVVGIRRRRRN